MNIANSAHTSPALLAAAITTKIKPPADTTTLSTSPTYPQLPQGPLTLPHLKISPNWNNIFLISFMTQHLIVQPPFQ